MDLARANEILAMIPAEQRRQQLSELLQELGRLPEVPDCTVLLPLVRHKWWIVRHDAMHALEKCRPDPRIGTALLGLLSATDDDYDRISANAALGSCGTAVAIPALAEQIHHRTDDVKCSAIFALARIAGESALPIFLDALTDR
jgi:HEAT repeat protein